MKKVLILFIMLGKYKIFRWVVFYGMSDQMKVGYWAVATQKHLVKLSVDNAHMDEFDSLNVSGKAGRLLAVLRGNGQLSNKKKLEKMASSVGIGKIELYRTILPDLERASDGQIELRKNTIGEIEGIEEYIFTQNKVLEITGQLFENLYPSDVERIAIETMDATKKIPHLESELMQYLSKMGFDEQAINLSCVLQAHFRLIQKLSRGGEPIFSNEYVWGPNHHKIAYAVSNLQLTKRQTLSEVIDIIQNYQGYPMEKLPQIDDELLLTAKKVGMINPTTIVTNRGLKKEFGFSPNLIEADLYNNDIMDDVKLMLASIRFGENYTQFSTIKSPAAFLNYFISNEKIGPHSANGTDYTLLEERGIVKVERHGSSNKYYMKLIRKDVAQEALKIVSNPSFNINITSDIKETEFEFERGTFKSPEETRLELSKPTENVTEAMDYLTRVLRDETL